MHARFEGGGGGNELALYAVTLFYFFFLCEHMNYLTKDKILKANHTFILVVVGTNNGHGTTFCRKKLWLIAPISESER